MQGVNKVIIIGRLGQDPDVRATPSGQTVASLNVATSESWVKEGQREERTEWHRVVVWGKQAEIAGKYLTKGRSVYIEGKLQTRSWDDQQTGQKRYMTEIVAQNIQFLDSSRNQADAPYGSQPQYGSSQSQTSENGYNQPAQSSPQTTTPDFGSLDDDVPF